MLNLQLCSRFSPLATLKTKRERILSHLNSIYHSLVSWAKRCFKRPDNDVCMACSSGNKKKRKKALIRTCFMGGGRRCDLWGIWILVRAGEEQQIFFTPPSDIFQSMHHIISRLNFCYFEFSKF
jgi:hypothetical protein